MYASRGEKVTCENGHYICTLAEDMPDWMTGTPKCEDWQQPEPAIGDQPVCQVCGGMWFCGSVTFPDGMILQGQFLHFPDGWRYWDYKGKEKELCSAEFGKRPDTD
jgi:hypothetical protein